MSKDVLELETKEDIDKKELETASKILVTLHDLKDYCKSFDDKEGGCENCLLYDRAEDDCILNCQAPSELNLHDRPLVKLSILDF